VFVSGVLVSSCFKQRHVWTRLESSPVDPASSQGVTQISAVESEHCMCRKEHWRVRRTRYCCHQQEEIEIRRAGSAVSGFNRRTLI
jgi:hypothetical protein